MMREPIVSSATNVFLLRFRLIKFHRLRNYRARSKKDLDYRTLFDFQGEESASAGRDLYRTFLRERSED